MKKILFISFNQFGYFSIYYNYCQFLKTKYNLSYLSFDENFEKQNITGVKTHYVPLYSSKTKRQFNFHKTAKEIIKNNQYDVVIVKYYKGCSLLKLFCPKQRILLDIRSGYFSKNILIRTFSNFSILFESLFFNKSLILSESLRTRLGISNKKSAIVPLGAYQLNDQSKKFSQLKLLYVGTITFRRIEDTVLGLKMFIEKNVSGIEISYDLIGFGTLIEEDRLKKYITDLKLSNHIIFHGKIIGNDLNPFFEKCNIGVAYVPKTKGYDVQPVTKIFEYMLSGMPVIATSTSENKKLLTRQNGILIEDNPENFCTGLQELLAIKDVYNSETIKRSVEDYKWENIIEKKLIPVIEE